MPNENGNLVQIKNAAAATPKPMDLEVARKKLDSARGPKYWRTLEEMSGDPSFTALLENEFPRYVSEWTDGVSRRNFLKLSAVSLAVAGLSACTRQPEEAIVPYVQQPEDLIPGKPLYFATARPSIFGASPLLVRSNEYHPTNIQGNPDHPISKGAVDAHSIGSLYDLYDPDRAQAVMYNGGLASRQSQMPGQRSWGDVVNDIKEIAAAQKGNGGAGIRFLTETITSPSLAAHIQNVLKGMPQAKWYQWDGINRDNARAGQRIAYGQYIEPQYQLEKADVIVSLDADFLSAPIFPGHLKLARDFAGRRKLDDPEDARMSRMYVVESQTTATGGKADHRLPMKHSQVEQFAAALAARVGAGGASADLADEKARKFLDVLAKDLTEARGRCVVIPGEQQSPAVHALAAVMNSALGATGKTVTFGDTVEIVPTEQVAALKELVADMNGGKVAALVIVGTDPVYSAPADLGFEKALNKVPFRVSAATHANSTSRLCHWMVPLAHYLESWGDARAYDGTISLLQPLIEPLYGGKTAYEVFAAFTENSGVTAYDTVRAYWQPQFGIITKISSQSTNFEQWWRRALHDGFIANSAPAARTAVAKTGGVQLSNAPANEVEIVFRPDPSILDGRFGNNGWLQELPKPVTKLTWDNAAYMSLNTANRLNVKTQDGITLTVGGRTQQAGVLVVPGMPDGSISVTSGYGQAYSGRVGTDRGFNAYALRTSTNISANTVKIARSSDRPFWPLALTQQQHLIDGRGEGVFKPEGEFGTSQAGEAAAERGIIRAASLAEYQENPKIFNEGEHEAPSRDLTLYGENGYSSWVEDPAKASTFGPDAPKQGHQWGMAIDMNSCVGCNACVVACYSENNIPVVGHEQVKRGRWMGWLRIDTYFESQESHSDIANPRAYFQPLPCMQCENAPCEPVCPVAATTHSPEGLNNMVYNRCVGTRYCSNNCPYKVRRFNFLLFADYETQSLYPMRNPDVTVRSRGVMEKCTYCVQRITAGRIQAEKENRKIRDGEVQTACQQSCPTDAIIFGDISDPNSRVSKLKRQQRNYALLADLNTRPRTTYLAAVRNTNEELEPKVEKHEGAHAG